MNTVMNSKIILNSRAAPDKSAMAKFMYRFGEGAGLAAVLVSIMLWASIADACFR